MFPEDLVAGRDQLVYYGASSVAGELIESGALVHGAVVWSLWGGYLREPSGEHLMEMLDAADVPLTLRHTSGHAHVDDLVRLVDAFEPARVVPIHSEATDRFADHFPRVEQHSDGERWEI